jgi:hypothetical protein
MVALGVYFAFMYFKCRRAFSDSLPVSNDCILAWRKTHKLKRTYCIRYSDKITVPLTYGVFRPVILLPKRIDVSNETPLSYILTHEFVHIRRLDALTKLVATAAVCVHWFNPLVWIMYMLLNRDIELSCDESVVRELGEAPKSAYALMLIGMAEKHSAFALYSAFSKYAIEERINAIMKNKKSSIAGILGAALLVAGTAAVFATSGANAQVANGDAHSKIAVGKVTATSTPAGVPYKAFSLGKSDVEYLYELDFLEYDAESADFYQPYAFNGKWVRAVYDPYIWNGEDCSTCTWYEGMNETQFNRSVGVRTVRDGQTNEITGLVEMSNDDVDAIIAQYNLSSSPPHAP